MSCRRRHGEMIFPSFGAANLNCQKHAHCTMHSSADAYPQVNVQQGYKVNHYTHQNNTCDVTIQMIYRLYTLSTNIEEK